MTLTRYLNGNAAAPFSVAYAGAYCDELAFMQFHPFGYSAADGALIGFAVAGVWCAAWGWKALNRTVRQSDPDETD
jgi:aspartate oxidase